MSTMDSMSKRNWENRKGPTKEELERIEREGITIPGHEKPMEYIDRNLRGDFDDIG